MKRRAFISMLGGVAAWPLAAHAQQQGDAGEWNWRGETIRSGADASGTGQNVLKFISL